MSQFVTMDARPRPHAIQGKPGLGRSARWGWVIRSKSPPVRAGFMWRIEMFDTQKWRVRRLKIAFWISYRIFRVPVQIGSGYLD